MIEIEVRAEGCVVPVRAQPGARKTGVGGEHDGMLKVAVSAPADKGRANAALVDALAEALGVKRSQVELVAGPTSREKKFLIRGVSPAELNRRLEMLSEI